MQILELILYRLEIFSISYIACFNINIGIYLNFLISVYYLSQSLKDKCCCLTVDLSPNPLLFLLYKKKKKIV